MHDYIVIGAGSSGCVVAGRLAAAGAKVLLLEAGGPDDSPNIRIPGLAEKLLDSPFDWGYRTLPQPELLGRRIFLPRGKCLGGSSAINSMVYMRGNRGDYDHWRQLGNEGWGYDDLLPYFIRSEGNQRYRDGFHGTSGPLIVSDHKDRSPLTEMFMAAAKEVGHSFTDDVNGARQEGYGYFQATIGRMGRCSAAVAFLHPAMATGNLTVVTNALSTRLMIEGGRAVAVAYLHEGRPETARAAQEIILSAGAINSPQLLLLSGIGPAAELDRLGVPVVNDLPGVGKNLQDHLYVYARFEVKQPPAPRDMSNAELEAAKHRFMSDGGGPLGSNFMEAGAFMRCDPASEYPDIQLHFELSFGASYFEGATRERNGFAMSPYICRPRSRGEIRLNSADPLDRPLIDPRYFSDPSDLALLVEGLKKALEIGNARAFAAAGARQIYPDPGDMSDAALAHYTRRNASTVWHPVGSCKMGSDPMAVVDDKLRVHGLSGLRIADASIMPVMVSGNTNAPCIMIGEKASDLILAG